ncbi:MAG: polyribonucleotide nucleotidyltransferase [Bdellovibrionaceae bacterium]|nr:polyribonucleotide nucleotidyltransferase [Pseudobdellovibrionaceae bacterium]
MQKHEVKFELDGKEVILETGRLAKQTHGSCLVTCGNNMVLVTAVSSTKETSFDFFPLTVEYAEKFYSTGKIPGGYFKREGRPTTDATLNARLIDRPIRPCFPEFYNYETQIVATILSYDGQTAMNSLASIGASAALHISNIPFKGPTAGLQIARIDGKFVINPSFEDAEKADLDIFIAATRNGILMVEGQAKFVSEKEVLDALKFGHQNMTAIFDAQDELRKLSGSPARREVVKPSIDEQFLKAAQDFLRPKVEEALVTRDKTQRYEALDKAKQEATTQLLEKLGDDEKQQREKELNQIFGDVKYQVARSMILDKGLRIDGRDTTTVRTITNEVALLPRAHGSGLFTRGETQVLGTVTLGTSDDELLTESLDGTIRKPFVLHYNFPPYSVGETGRMGGQSRREIGHGNLAERALKAVIPDKEAFPYAIRIVSEVLESNGSSSMGTVCAGTLALLDGGVPITGNVAGIAMGLIKEGDRIAILTDILGDEDHLGDMDFKVAGTRKGITALQMDIKIDSLTMEIMEKALNQSLAGRIHILDEMEKVIKEPRGQISDYAPRIETIKINPDKVREVIGAGGKVIKGIIEATGVKINIEDDGTIHIASVDPKDAKAAIQMIEDICAEAEVGKVYSGKVVKLADFGAFVEILPNTSGLLHISEISHERIRSVSDVLKQGDVIDVKVLDVDRSGRIKLSRKVLLENSAE